jgi:hypothetical protein
MERLAIRARATGRDGEEWECLGRGNESPMVDRVGYAPGTKFVVKNRMTSYAGSGKASRRQAAATAAWSRTSVLIVTMWDKVFPLKRGFGPTESGRER